MYSVTLKKSYSHWELGLNLWPRLMFGLLGGFFLAIYSVTLGRPLLALICGLICFISAGYWESWIFVAPQQSTQNPSTDLELKHTFSTQFRSGVWPLVKTTHYEIDTLARVEVQIPRGKVFATLATSAKNLGQEFLGTRLDRRVIQIFLVFRDGSKPLRVLTESTKDYARIQQMAQELAEYLRTDFLVREV